MNLARRERQGLCEMATYLLAIKSSVSHTCSSTTVAAQNSPSLVTAAVQLPFYR